MQILLRRDLPEAPGVLCRVISFTIPASIMSSPMGELEIPERTVYSYVAVDETASDAELSTMDPELLETLHDHLFHLALQDVVVYFAVVGGMA